jgi:hypothetical protein
MYESGVRALQRPDYQGQVRPPSVLRMT